MCLNDEHNIRISASCSDPRHISSEIPYHTPRPPCGNVRRIFREDPRWLAARLSSGWTRVLTALLREKNQSSPKRWLFDSFPIPVQIFLIPAAIGGQRVSIWEDMLNHTYPDGGPSPESSTPLAFLRSLELASAPSEVGKCIPQRTAPRSLLYAWMGLCRLAGLALPPLLLDYSPANYGSGGLAVEETKGLTAFLRFLPELPWWRISI